MPHVLAATLAMTLRLDGVPAAFELCAEDETPKGLGAEIGRVRTGAGDDDLVGSRPTLGAASAVLFVNFDGGPGSPRVWGGSAQGTHMAFGTDEQAKAAIFEAMKKHWEPFNVVLTRELPSPTPSFLRTVTIGPTQGRYGGYCLIDCEQTAPQVGCSVWASAQMNPGLGVTAVAATHELGHSLGLDHVQPRENIMFAQANADDQAWQDECVTRAAGSCGRLHTAACGAADQQNAFQTLLKRLGPRDPSTPVDTTGGVSSGGGTPPPTTSSGSGTSSGTSSSGRPPGGSTSTSGGSTGGPGTLGSSGASPPATSWSSSGSAGGPASSTGVTSAAVDSTLGTSSSTSSRSGRGAEVDEAACACRPTHPVRSFAAWLCLAWASLARRAPRTRRRS